MILLRDAFSDSSDIGVESSDSRVRTRFWDLAHWWHAETDGLSSDSQKIDHEAYQTILSELGSAAIPYMLQDLRDNGAHWFSALRQLADKAVDADARGNMRRSRELWLRWAKETYRI
jgi:hypothetical protein